MGDGAKKAAIHPKGQGVPDTPLPDFLLQKKPAVVKNWRQLIYETYPADTAGFLSQEKDRFANPVGHTFSQALEAIYQEICGEMRHERLSECLTEIIKVRVVQDFSPSEVVEFVFLLKAVLRNELAAEVEEKGFIGELLEIESRIDRLALLALDIYTRCRDKIHEIKLKEIRHDRDSALKLAEIADRTSRRE